MVNSNGHHLLYIIESFISIAHKQHKAESASSLSTSMVVCASNARLELNKKKRIAKEMAMSFHTGSESAIAGMTEQHLPQQTLNCELKRSHYLWKKTLDANIAHYIARTKSKVAQILETPDCTFRMQTQRPIPTQHLPSPHVTSPRQCSYLLPLMTTSSDSKECHIQANNATLRTMFAILQQTMARTNLPKAKKPTTPTVPRKVTNERYFNIPPSNGNTTILPSILMSIPLVESAHSASTVGTQSGFAIPTVGTGTPALLLPASRKGPLVCCVCTGGRKVKLDMSIIQMTRIIQKRDILQLRTECSTAPFTVHVPLFTLHYR